MALQKPESFTEDDVMQRHDTKARKDTTVSFRVSSQELELIKQAARTEGYPKYQTWLRHKLTEAVANALGVANDPDDE